MTDFDKLYEIFNQAGLITEKLTYDGERYFLLINDQLQLTFNTDDLSLKNYHVLPFDDKSNEEARQRAKSFRQS